MNSGYLGRMSKLGDGCGGAERLRSSFEAVHRVTALERVTAPEHVTALERAGDRARVVKLHLAIGEPA